jgi:hypothetical protein
MPHNPSIHWRTRGDSNAWPLPSEGEKRGYPGIRHSTLKYDNILKYIILLKIGLRRDTLKPPTVFSLVVSIW